MLLKRLINKQRIILGKSLGSGGEGTIYEVEKQPLVVAKVYHKEKLTQAHGDKLRAMLTNPPQQEGTSSNPMAIAWPLDLLIPPNGSRKIVGFLMPRVKDARPLHQYYTPKQRREHSPFFNYIYLLQTARNLAMAAKAIHSKGYVIGDLNESNILVTQTTLVTLVDADSFQVFDHKKGHIYRCPVGKVESTPPELQGTNFGTIDRRQEHDLFGLAVLIFQLLMEGNHPFDGVFKGKGEPPGKKERIKMGHFPYGSKKNVPYRPKPIAPPFKVLAPKLQELFRRCFQEGHENPQARPTAGQWATALEEAKSSLVTCSQNEQHRHGKHLKHCPWCKRRNLLGGADPFPSLEAVKKGEHIPIIRKKTPPPTTSTSRKKEILFGLFWEWKNFLIKSLLYLSLLFSFYPLFWLATSSFQAKPFSKDSAIANLSIASKLEDVVTISGDGTIGARAKEKGKIEIWDLDSRKKLYTLEGKNRSISAMAISAKNDLLISGSIDGELEIFDLKNREWKQEIRGHDSVVKSLAIAGDGRIFTSGSGDGTIAIWGFKQTWRKIAMEKQHKSSVLSLAMSANDRTLVSGSSDYQIKVWNLSNGSLKNHLKTEGYWVNSVDISADGKILAIGGDNGAIAILDLNQNKQQYTLKGHKKAVYSVAISPDGGTLVSGGEDGKIIIWNLTTGKVKHILGHNNIAVHLVTITPDGKRIISRSGPKKIVIWAMPENNEQ